VHDLDVVAVSEHLGERGDEPGIDLDRDDPRHRVGQAQRERSEPGPISSTVSSGARSGRGDDPSDRVRVDDEVLTGGLPRREPVRVEQPTDLGGVSRSAMAAPRVGERGAYEPHGGAGSATPASRWTVASAQPQHAGAVRPRAPALRAGRACRRRSAAHATPGRRSSGSPPACCGARCRGGTAARRGSRCRVLMLQLPPDSHGPDGRPRPTSSVWWAPAAGVTAGAAGVGADEHDPVPGLLDHLARRRARGRSPRRRPLTMR
jgi:hypothetical protein